MRDGTKCDYCAQPGTRLVGESNEIIVCWNHVPNRPETERDEHQWNALEMARRADQAERRAEEAEYHVEQLRDARDRAERQAEDAEAAVEATRDLLDGWEHDGPDDPATSLLIQRVREMLALGERFREARDGAGHE